MDAVIKAGTGVVKRPKPLAHALRRTRAEYLVVPGGWRFADAVRRAQEELGFSDDTAHWAAIAAMDQTGLVLAELLNLKATPYPETRAVLLPYRWLEREDPLPRSWQATSDSISIWIASRVGAETVVAVKDVPGVILDDRPVDTVKASEIKGRETAVDPLAPELAERYDVEIRVVPNDDPDNITAAVEGDNFVGTRILP